jgi:hypothetical protein
MFTKQISSYINKKPNKIYDLSTSGKYIFIRHGETNYNAILQEIKKEIAGVDPIHLDMPLNEKGINQCKELSNSLKEFKLKIILTSPLRRTLETTYYSLINHPDKENIKILICPLLTETVTATHDYSINMQEKKQFFSKENLGLDFDWSLFEEKFPFLGDQEFYYLKYIDNIDKNDVRNNEIIQKLLEKIEEINMINSHNKEFYEKYKEHTKDKIEMYFGDLAHFYFIISKKKPESLNHLFIRSLMFKEYLGNLKKNLNDLNFNKVENILNKSDNFNNDNDNYSNFDIENIDDKEKILVFTHSAFIKISSSEEAYGLNEIETYPNDCVIVKNCGMISINI